MKIIKVFYSAINIIYNNILYDVYHWGF